MATISCSIGRIGYGKYLFGTLQRPIGLVWSRLGYFGGTASRKTRPMAKLAWYPPKWTKKGYSMIHYFSEIARCLYQRILFVLCISIVPFKVHLPCPLDLMPPALLWTVGVKLISDSCSFLSFIYFYGNISCHHIASFIISFHSLIKLDSSIHARRHFKATESYSFLPFRRQKR